MERNILDFLESSTSRYPDKTAFSSQDADVSFSQLRMIARHIGSAISEQCKPRSAIAVLADARSIPCVTGMLGVLYAGCCYSVLDIGVPSARLSLILDMLNPALLLCDEKGHAAASAAHASIPTLLLSDAAIHPENPSSLDAIRQQASLSDPVSVMFTSGSTGVPKGVMHTQAAYLAWTEATCAKYGFTTDTVFGSQSPLFYANSLIDLYVPLALGARVCLMPASLLSFPRTMISFLNTHGITELTMTPSSFAAIASAGILAPGCLPTVEYLILSGETAAGAVMQKWLKAAPSAHVWNFYGSTEVFSVAVQQTNEETLRSKVIPVGVPFDGVDVRIIDEDGISVPDGVDGEMLIHTPWMSACYWNDSFRTLSAYVTQGSKTYFRTGDIGCFDKEGRLMVLGRKDGQIKHRGYRMELGEVEHALHSIPGWTDGCCLHDREHDSLMCIWTGTLEQKNIVAALKKVLPSYAIPDRYIHLENLPYTPTMKLDRKALYAAVANPISATI